MKQRFKGFTNYVTWEYIKHITRITNINMDVEILTSMHYSPAQKLLLAPLLQLLTLDLAALALEDLSE